MRTRTLGALPLCLALACGSASADGHESEAAESTESSSSSSSGPVETPAPRATRVETATVTPSPADLTLRLPGEVEGSRDALLAAALGGYVEAVQVEEGEEVRRNQVLARVDAASHGARLAQARVELDAAQRELDRAERLGGAIGEQQRDAAQARVDAAQAAVRTAQVQAGRATIRAPFAGTIAAVDIERGEVAPPGAPAIRLVQLDPVHVNLAVPDRDVVALRPGMEARVWTNARGEPFEGRVLRISPAADLQTRAFSVDVEVQNPEGELLPGMIAQVEIHAGAAEPRIVLPQYVLVTRVSENGVFVHRDGVAHWRPVEVERVVRDQIIVASGVSAGDEVVVTGHRELAEGDTLLVAREGRCCESGRVVFDEEAGPVAQLGEDAE